MGYPHKDILDTFTEASLPDLDVVTLGALELLGGAVLPDVSSLLNKKVLVVGSGNAAVTGSVIFNDVHALHADESTYERILACAKETLDAAVLISASGGKHATHIAETLKNSGLPTYLMTTNREAPAGRHIEKDRIFVFPKNREPYTYNTSTYMSMLQSKSKEDVANILAFIMEDTARTIPDNLARYDAFYFIVPDAYANMREMFATKFDELFGPHVSGRIFTHGQTMHAKTVVPSETELFISIGEKDTDFGLPGCQLHIPLPKDAGVVAMLAVTYFVIGHIQKQHPSYFKDNISNYTREAERLFGSTITPVVE